MAEDVNLAAVILSDMPTVFDCTLYNQGEFGKQRASWFYFTSHQALNAKSSLQKCLKEKRKDTLTHVCKPNVSSMQARGGDVLGCS